GVGCPPRHKIEHSTPIAFLKGGRSLMETVEELEEAGKITALFRAFGIRVRSPAGKRLSVSRIEGVVRLIGERDKHREEVDVIDKCDVESRLTSLHQD